MGPAITVIVQLTTACNLACPHCYVMRSRQGPSAMEHQGIRRLIAGCAQGFSSVELCWHGGEPLLLGRPFFESVVETQREIARGGVQFRNTVQTNATLLTDEWLAFFRRHDFGIGTSFDAPREVHDRSRPFRDGSSSADAVLDASRRMRQWGFAFRPLCVVTKHNVRKAREIFECFRSLEASSYSLLTVMSPGSTGEDLPTNDEVFTLYRETFDLWLSEANRFKDIQPIDTFVRAVLGGRARLCTFASSCLRRMIAVTPCGDVIPCGSFSAPEYVLGNVFRESLLSCLASRRARELSAERAGAVQRQCHGCEFIASCRGGCREAAYWASGSYGGPFPYCDARKRTFEHIRARVSEEVNKARRSGARALPFAPDPLGPGL